MPRLSQEEIDVKYWEHELISVVRSHEEAIEALCRAGDELSDVRRNLRAARERLATKASAVRRQATGAENVLTPDAWRPTPRRIHPAWVKDEAS